MDPQTVLDFWFCKDPSQISNQQLWFKIEQKRDDLIKQKFGAYLAAAETGDLNYWIAEEKSSLALIIVLDQFSRFVYRGTAKMFSNSSRSFEITNKLLKTDENLTGFSLIEKYFIYYSLLSVEEVQAAQRACDKIKLLCEECPSEQKTNFLKLFNSATSLKDLLLKYGRYPHWNSLLDRESTQEELAFLKRYRHTFVKSVQPEVVKTQKPPKEDVPKPVKSQEPPQRLLFLHGFRQSSNKIKKRLSRLTRFLKQECNAHVFFLNGTHPYQQTTADDPTAVLDKTQFNQLESQRIWYNSNADSTIYEGIDEAYAHVLTHVRSEPPYDGIVGFSQGAVLASILLGRNPDLFRYFISISGFAPRCLKYANLYSASAPSHVNSLHIYGKNDLLVDPSRSKHFAECFKDSQVVEHSAGHFAPDNWPLSLICQFIQKQASQFKPSHILDSESLDIKLIRLNINLQRFGFDQLKLDTLLEHQWAKDLLNSNKFDQFFTNKSSLNDLNLNDNSGLNDQIMLAYLLINKASNQAETDLVLKLWIDLYKRHEAHFIDEAIVEKYFIPCQHWKELVGLCDLACQEAKVNKQLEVFYIHLIEIMSEQLIFDLSWIDKQKNKFYVQQLTSFYTQSDTELAETNKKIKIKLNEENNFVSGLAICLPRIKNAIDKRSRIGRELANRMNPYTKHECVSEEQLKGLKMLSYNRYRKILSTICTFLASNEYENPRKYFFLSRYDRATMERLMEAPLSDSILNPVPEPVDLASREQMQPLYDWLSLNQLLLEDEDLKFLKGVVTTDGRLDLCKQVIGPAGISPLLDAMAGSKQVNRILLGNNIIGDEGGQLISNFIRSGRSPIKIWYIAGNQFTHKGIEPIAEALLNDTQVTALWLKRNPLKSAGMIPIANLMVHNTTLTVLDLLNCGLLDSGVKILFDGLKSNNSLKHLYLSANGITPNGLQHINEYFKSANSVLETLFLGCNRIGNEGAKIVADFLPNTKLKRLNLSSSRIGAEGMKYLSDALAGNQFVEMLDIGFMRATMDLGELGNYISDEGAVHLAAYLKATTKLVSLNITHNHITEKGMQSIINAVDLNTSLIYFDYVQYGVSLDESALNKLKRSSLRNEKQFLENNSQEALEAIVKPEHVKEIYSVYRTH